MADMTAPSTAWRGAHHIALATSDLDATVAFYHRLLGMPLMGGSGGSPIFGRHYAFSAGDFLVGFFERAVPAEPASAPGWSRGFQLVPGALQHLALSVEDEATLEGLRKRLVDAGVEVTGWLHEGPMRQFLFADNNGILWEVNWTPDGAEDEWTFDDPDPTPTARAIMEASLRRETAEP